MAIVAAKTQCFVCKKETRPLICGGCSESFCPIHLNKHLQTFGEQLDQIENDHDQFKQKFIDEKINAKNHSLIQQIDEWEKDSIQIIKQTADQCRQKLINYINKVHSDLENELNDLAKQLKDVRDENSFNEIDLNQCKNKLNKLQEEFDKASNFLIGKESTSFINKIFVIIPFNKDAKWKQVGITIAGGNSQGDLLNQLSRPQNIFIDDDRTLYIADMYNHRILEWKPNAKSGRIVIGENGPGDQMNQLCYPTNIVIDKENNSMFIADYGNRRVMRWPRQNNTTSGEIVVSDIACSRLALDKNGSLYVSDYKKNEVRRWRRREKNGTIVAGGNGEGNQLNQLSLPSYIFVDEDYSLYITDMNNHRVMKWLKDAKEGIVVAGGNGRGDNLTQLSSPQGVTVDQFGHIYVADWCNDRIMRWCTGGKTGTIIVGGNGQGKDLDQFNCPNGLSFDREGNLYVVDCRNDRIQKFERYAK